MRDGRLPNTTIPFPADAIRLENRLGPLVVGNRATAHSGLNSAFAAQLALFWRPVMRALRPVRQLMSAAHGLITDPQATVAVCDSASVHAR